MDRELKRLVLFAVGAFVVLLVGRQLVSSVWDAEAAWRAVDAERRKLEPGQQAAERPGRAEQQRLSALRDELSAELARLVPAVGYELPADFAVPAGTSPDLRYLEIHRREHEQLVERAAFFGKSVPSNLGMPELNPTGLQDVLAALRSLHVVHLVVTAALDAGIERVEEIEPTPGGRRARVEGRFVRGHRVDFELVGTLPAVHETLRRVAGGTPYLALDEVRLQSADDDGQRVRCRFAAQALVLDTAAPLVTAAGS